jgi:hypothetical protein
MALTLDELKKLDKLCADELNRQKAQKEEEIKAEMQAASDLANSRYIHIKALVKDIETLQAENDRLSALIYRNVPAPGTSFTPECKLTGYWHPASEPPVTNKDVGCKSSDRVIVKFSDGLCSMGRWMDYNDNKHWATDIRLNSHPSPVVQWIEIPK